MSVPFHLKPGHRAVRGYYVALAQFANVGARHESAVRAAFDQLIEGGAGPLKWTLVREYEMRRKGESSLRLDGALLDQYRLVHGCLEAKDDADDLAQEMHAKLKLGYPAKNTLFWQPRRALLVQDGKVARDLPIVAEDGTALAENLVEVLALFFSYAEPAIADWERAIEEFKDRLPELGKSVSDLIHRARAGAVPNRKFVVAFDAFAALCRSAINPSLSVEAIEEMLIQHLLTARLFGSVFNNPDFTRRNVIAVEIEKVIDALAAGHFSRTEFLQKLDRFYLAIEAAAATLDDFSEKQKFLNTVYEKFFQGFAVKVADTMGVVYTPPSIVRFMIASIRELLKKEFGKDLGDAGVHFLDPFTGTGNFLVHLMREIPRAALPRKYAGELWANEIMLLPYYIAGLTWLHDDESVGFAKFALIGSKESKATGSLGAHAIFRTYGRGVCSNNDDLVYDFDAKTLAKRALKMSKDKTALVYNQYLTLAGLPPEVQEYRLGNRSALDWVIDQYRVERAKNNPEEIVSDPNRGDDLEYILRLIGQVVTVSVETARTVKSLPPLD